MSIIDKLFGDNDKPRDTPAKADGPMQKVLDELASLGGKPIETLSPEEARQQPTPTDAVKSLLRKDGKLRLTLPAVSAPGLTAGPANHTQDGRQDAG